MSNKDTAIATVTPAAIESRPVTPMELLSTALSHNAAIDVIERLAALQEKAMAKDAEMQFNESMNAAQSEISRIAPNRTNNETNSPWATYDKLDKVLRPIYIKNGFSLSFTTDECPKPETERIVCFVSHRAGHTRRYQKDIPADGKGPKGGSVMTRTHASGAASSYGMRYLLRMIFNVAIGEEDTDGNLGWLDEAIEWIENATPEELEPKFKEFYKKARESKSTSACQALVKSKDKRKKELGL